MQIHEVKKENEERDAIRKNGVKNMDVSTRKKAE
jgi:hypothetical protein